MKAIEYKEFETKGAKLGEDGIVRGYAAVFGNEDNQKDKIHPGAFAKTIKENGGSVVMLANHDRNKVIGRVTHLEEDSYGLKFEASLAPTDAGVEYRTLMTGGFVDKFSIGYKVIKGGRSNGGGRDIFEVKLYEVSSVAIPMNEKAVILEAKSMGEDDHRESVIKRYEDLAKSMGNKDTKLQDEAELMKLAEEYKTATQPTEVTEPEVSEEAKEQQFLTELNEALQN